MISISRDEAKYIREHGQGHCIHVTSAHHKGKAKHNYLSTTYKAMKLLEEYRAARNTIVYGG